MAETRYKDVWGGRGGGRSFVGTDYFLSLITAPTYFRGYFIRQTFSDIRTSLYQDFKDRVEANPTLREKDFRFNENRLEIGYIPTGNMIFSKGVAKDGSRSAKMKSLAGATHVLIEEADEIGEEDFDQLDLSLRTTRVDRVEVIRLFNPPPKNHWIWRDYNLIAEKININGNEHTFYRAVPQSKSGITSMFATYRDNIVNLQESTIKTLERFKQSNPEYYYNQVEGLISDGARGRIYTDWLPVTDEFYNALELPKVYGLDFGYSNDPNALLEVKYQDDKRYCKELLYETHLDNLQLAKRLRDLGIYPTDVVIGDYGNGGDLRIAELRRGWQGIEGYPDLTFNIHAGIKGPNSINFGIGKVKACKNYLTESSRNGWSETRKYKWALDANKNPTDTPIDEDNHLMDARRYVELNKGRIF